MPGQGFDEGTKEMASQHFSFTIGVRLVFLGGTVVLRFLAGGGHSVSALGPAVVMSDPIRCFSEFRPFRS